MGPSQVQDKSAEVGIKLQNVLTALVLMVMAWVGWNIQSMKESLTQIKIDDALLANEVLHLHEQDDVHEARSKKIMEIIEKYHGKQNTF